MRYSQSHAPYTRRDVTPSHSRHSAARGKQAGWVGVTSMSRPRRPAPRASPPPARWVSLNKLAHLGVVAGAASQFSPLVGWVSLTRLGLVSSQVPPRSRPSPGCTLTTTLAPAPPPWMCRRRSYPNTHNVGPVAAAIAYHCPDQHPLQQWERATTWELAGCCCCCSSGGGGGGGRDRPVGGGWVGWLPQLV